MINYIKNIKLFNEKTNTTYTLDFKPGTNIIIGPKGGGKSTLLNLIYSLYKKQKLPNNVEKALKEFQLQPISIEYFDGQITNMNELSILDKSDEIITQLDDNKTRLNENKEIATQRDRFVEMLVTKNANAIVSLFEEYFQTFFDMYKIRLRPIQ
jgi:recombinational DNA repair ATPase RecF